MHVLTDADVNDNSDISLTLDVLLSEHRGCPTEVSCCCSVGFAVDFEKDPVSLRVRRASSVSVAEGERRFQRRSPPSVP